jgi:hypothetical protein
VKREPRHAPVIANGCRRRVWSSGDTDPCGKEVIVDGYCLECRLDIVKVLQDSIRSKRSALAQEEEHLALLTSDEVLDTIALKEAL